MKDVIPPEDDCNGSIECTECSLIRCQIPDSQAQILNPKSQIPNPVPKSINSTQNLNAPLCLVDISFLFLFLHPHDHAVLGNAEMPLLHLLRRLVRHIVSDRVDGIADEGEYAENDKQDEQGGEFRESRHNDCVIGKRGG